MRPLWSPLPGGRGAMSLGRLVCARHLALRRRRASGLIAPVRGKFILLSGRHGSRRVARFWLVHRPAGHVSLLRRRGFASCRRLRRLSVHRPARHLVSFDTFWRLDTLWRLHFKNLHFCSRVGGAMLAALSTNRISDATLHCRRQSRTDPVGWRPSLWRLPRRRPSPQAIPSHPSWHRPTSGARPHCPCR